MMLRQQYKSKTTEAFAVLMILYNHPQTMWAKR